MRRVIVQEWMTLDGVVQAPGAEDEDTSGGFKHGGWHLRYFDDASMAWVLEQRDGGGRLPARPPHVRVVRLPLAGRARGGAGPWPGRSTPNRSTWRRGRSTDPLAWEHSTTLKGDVAEAAAGLKQENGGDLLVIGSTALVRTLMEHDLVDEYRVMIDPLVLGGGKRIFPDGGVGRPLRLVDSQVTTTGAIVATYAATRD